MPVHNGHKVHKSTGHGNVGDISCPDLVGAIDGQVSEQIWVNLVCRMRPAGMRLWVDCFYAHQSHQPLNAFTVDLTALSAEMSRHRPAAVGWRFHVLLVNQAHQLQVFGFNPRRLVVERGPAYVQKLALS